MNEIIDTSLQQAYDTYLEILKFPVNEPTENVQKMDTIEVDFSDVFDELAFYKNFIKK